LEADFHRLTYQLIWKFFNADSWKLCNADWHGINANLLCKWIKQYQNRPSVNTANYSGFASSAFVPVITLIAAKTAEMELTVTLANGVQLAIQGVGLADCSSLLHALAALPCSASTQG